FTLGTVLMRSAGCCVNDVADRDFDRHVKRTAQRPVTTGAVSAREALLLGAALASTVALAFWPGRAALWLTLLLSEALFIVLFWSAGQAA
ncbi:UbiA family prenyltransferase, partial [Serratia marcescens]|uniref:UbiA family prenyltransferase n=1 Tax=Serratia marcescens TaxID=615 RepID=UPI0013DBAB87